MCVEGLRKIKKRFSNDSRLSSLNPERSGSASPLTATLMFVPSGSGYHSDAIDDSACRLLNSYRRFGGT